MDEQTEDSPLKLMPNCPFHLCYQEYSTFTDCAGCVNGSGCKDFIEAIDKLEE